MASLRASPLVVLLGAIFFLATQVFAAHAVLGVDLGTEYIKGALVKQGKAIEIVLTKDSRRKETSAVAFKPAPGGPKEGAYPERAYGADAMALSARFPAEVYPNLKSLLGLPIDDPAAKEYASRHPAMQMQSHPSRGTVEFKTKALTADEDAWMVEELLAMELQSIRQNAEGLAGDGTTVRSIVLTVPPFYTVDEKRAVQTAAELAGLKVLSLISDGLAVGLNYATTRQFPNLSSGEKPEYHLVFDMGAGSSKATIMRFQSRTVKDVGKLNKTVQEVQVLGSGWDRTLGGDALNYLIVDDMVSQFVESKAAQKISASAENVKAHGRAIAKLSKEAERLRHVLSANQNTQASFEGLYEDVDFKYKITRADFEKMAEEHAERVGATIKDALAMSSLDIGDLTSVILHGGASRTPFVQKALEKVVGSPDKIRTNVNSDEAAAFGAGFRAADLSPSFRVKEIRISDGTTYPAGLKWTNPEGKPLRQRLWTAVSTLGGAPKEVTFNDPQKESTMTVYQQVGSDDKDIKTIETKNLTKTVAAMKEKYPSCTETGVQFKLGLKFSSENGEIVLAKAAVECEVEVTEKEGFVDGVKNLFGFGKKDQEPLKDGEATETPETPEGEIESDKTESTATSSATESETSTATSEATTETPKPSEEAKYEPAKKEIVSIPVEVTVTPAGIPQLVKEDLDKSKQRLKSFAASDRSRAQREEALNQLEGYTYRVRDNLEDETFISKSTETERTKIAETASFVSEWLYGDGSDATKDELKAKLKELQDLVNPIRSRVDEDAKRPEAVSNLKEALNATDSFIRGARDYLVKIDEWHASESAKAASSTESAAAAESTGDGFEGLEDEDSTADKGKTMEDLDKERGPPPSLYKPEEIDSLEKLYKDISAWLEELEPSQAALGATEDPVLLVKDIQTKRDKLDQAGKELAMKGFRDFERKAKKSGKDKKKDKSSKSKSKSKAKSDGAKDSTVSEDDIFNNFDDIVDFLELEDADELLSKISPETLKKAQELKKKMDEAKTAKPDHDEL